MTSLGLTRDPEDYVCLRNSCFEIKDVDDSKEFDRLNVCFENLGMTDPSRYYKIIAAILHLSNIEFAENEDQACINNSCNKGNVNPVEMACKLLNISVTDFLKEVLHPSIKAGNETVTHSRTKEECLKVIEGLMKMLYDSLFDNLVFEINSILDISSSDSFIGVLDIAGFEIFENNSFEQLCINYTNEKLQQFFNHHMFILEQEIYKNECIDWNFIDFGLDLEPTIRLIESNNPIGILSYLDEECVMPKASDDTLLNKIKGIQGVEKCPFKNTFRIKHYAGLVEYEVKDWLNKNKDVHSENLHKLASSHLLSTRNDSNIKKGIFRTVSQSHRENLRRLMDLLRNTNPHFVRCILPNLNKNSSEFNKKLILDQLKCNGVLEGIRISRLGYPSRISFKEFNERYLILLNVNTNVMSDDNVNMANELLLIPKNLSKSILESIEINSNDYRIGNTMVFLRQGVLADMEDMRERRISRLSRVVTGILLHKIELRRSNINQERQKAIVLLQKNANMTYELLKWKWWALFIKIKPLLEVQKNEESIREKDEQIRAYADLVERERKERKKMEACISSLNNSVEEFKKTNDLSRLALDEKEGLLEGLRRENTELLSSLDKQSKSIESLKDKVRQCEIKEENHCAAIKDLNAALEQTNKELKSKEETISNLVQKGGDLNSVLKLKESEINEILKSKDELEKMVCDIKTENELVKGECSAHKNTISALEEKISCQDDVIRKTKNEFDDVQFENESLQGEIRKKEHITQENNRQISALKQELEYFKAKTNTLESSLLANQEQAKSLESKIEELKSIKNGTQETVVSLHKQIKTLSLKLSNLESINSELSREKDEMYEENQRLAKEKIEALCLVDCRENQERKALQLEIHKLRLENEKLRSDIANGSSSHDEGMESILDKINQQLENEKSIKKQYERKVNELETGNAILENRIRELNQQLKESEESCIKVASEFTHNFVPKTDVIKLKEGLESVRNEANLISDLFQIKFFEILDSKNLQIESLINEISRLSNELSIARSENESLKEHENANMLLKREIEDVLKKNSLLKTEIDALTVNNESSLIQIGELKDHIGKLQTRFDEREDEIERIKREYNKEMGEILQKKEELKKNLCKVQELIGHEITDGEVSRKINSAVKPFAERVEALNRQLNEANVKIAEKEAEISRLSEMMQKLSSNLEGAINAHDNPVNLSNASNNSIDGGNLIRERLVSSFVVDKDALKTIERKKLLSCNCGLLNKVKVVEIQRENKEEVVRLINENNLLNLKLRQTERVVEEQSALVESMRGCISILKKKSK
ncbi:uncharacterized protein VICG_01717 [Vittaforma corneae ATCC 50505]|uniref:Myosin motor domain-containing protein n=1 Tax=Vittaforma corneae (strain ATCC 50505) TaxID=993615 RepID=L2GK18_VITCO|nr:uncharacterized protein VICG_01717 [Vittaforma corneae ATCC 50505]ELA41228.1 hypothetical protein VICG_01717 [Vittaforma corneae ATCC 50505]